MQSLVILFHVKSSAAEQTILCKAADRPSTLLRSDHLFTLSKMTTEADIEKIRPYFTDDEWENLPDFAKYRYANIKVNYELMLNVGK